MLALDGEETDVVDGALACVGVRVGTPAHSLQRRQSCVQQDSIQIGNVEPETAALAAAEEDAIFSLGELDHLDGVTRAIHGLFSAPIGGTVSLAGGPAGRLPAGKHSPAAQGPRACTRRTRAPRDRSLFSSAS